MKYDVMVRREGEAGRLVKHCKTCSNASFEVERLRVDAKEGDIFYYKEIAEKGENVGANGFGWWTE